MVAPHRGKQGRRRGIPTQYLSGRWYGRCDDRAPDCQCLDQDASKTLPFRRETENISGGQQRRHIGSMTQEPNFGLGGLRGFSQRDSGAAILSGDYCYGAGVIGRHFREGPYQMVEALLRV